ncbi:MarR family winged helix-turn-helix transcriptional regulator [Hyphococcus sp.]|jgi:DNA-binding MarR family transcriptional regulator|uniref:MarR family winged helix-turn-helix transcriptional regulator n=1 Tax=Hyphococcus sp. TaxID=2038636 RepID=UPI003D09CE1D
MHDHVDLLVRQWAEEMPDMDTAGMEIFGRARRISRKVSEEIVPLLKAYGIDGGQFYVLTALRRAGEPYELRPTEIYQTLMISSGGLTNRLSRLEAAGLIRRRASKEDARSMTVQLTAKGRKLVEQAIREDMAREAELLKGLTGEEKKTLANLLRKLSLSVGA